MKYGYSHIVLINTVLFTLLMFLIISYESKTGYAIDEGKVDEAKVMLITSVIFNTKPTVLKFTLINTSDKEITINDFVTNDNDLEIVTPNGKTKYLSSSKYMPKQICVKTKSEYSWQYDVQKIFDFAKLTEKGTYKITWIVGKLMATPIYVTIE